MRYALLCLAFCQAHLYLNGIPTTGAACLCCDADGCDRVELCAPRPMVLTLGFKAAPRASEEEKDERPTISYDDDK